MKKKIAAVIACALLLTGCEEHTELGERAIIQAAAIDTNENGYSVNALLFSSSGSGLIDASEENVIRTDGAGATLAQAIDDVAINDGRAVYMSDVKIVIFGAGFEQGDIAQALNTLYFDMDCGLDTLVACADEPAAIARLGFTEGVTSAEKLAELIENANRAGLTPKTTLLDALCALAAEREFLLPFLAVEENGGMTSQKDGLSAVPNGARTVFGGRLGGKLTSEQTAGALLAAGENDKITLNYFVGGNERCCDAYAISVKMRADGSAEVSARFRAKNGANLTQADKDGAMERLCAIVKAGL